MRVDLELSNLLHGLYPLCPTLPTKEFANRTSGLSAMITMDLRATYLTDKPRRSYTNRPNSTINPPQVTTRTTAHPIPFLTATLPNPCCRQPPISSPSEQPTIPRLHIRNQALLHVHVETSPKGPAPGTPSSPKCSDPKAQLSSLHSIDPYNAQCQLVSTCHEHRIADDDHRRFQSPDP